ncbi:MAG: hypothetical protein GYB33_08880 [Gammaproteobacteria bacterium]|uniref:hypothetical protein n=1 Tax=Pseudomaricurvus alcaniphilus TaxID=1166482 RepID=UPI00140CD39A|nr:hypothetical protein [Pseudomaricurvus alcaniphilus]MBR9910448.1 hypothetical protein [Gammaproteobacteria bacterium]NHN36156.1 hypothetical protein [Pseudomaricurvus alcaniphilus]
MNTIKAGKSTVKWFVQLAACVIFTVTAQMSLAGWAGDKIQVREPGKLYNQLSGDWWNWAMQFPLATNPILEDGAVDCSRGQRGKVWFLAGTFGGTASRSCTVPAGKALFFPLTNSLWWAPEDGEDAVALRVLANDQVDPVSVLEITINGVAIEDPFAYRAQSLPGGFDLDFGPLLADLGIAPEPDPRIAVADGYWILLAPLKKGVHEIHFHAITGDPDSPDFEIEVTYYISVVNGGHGFGH